MADDLIDRARHEVAEDRRIAALALQQHTKDALLRRAQVTEDLIVTITYLRRQHQHSGDHMCDECWPT